jgi:hypothetical protein
MSQQKDMGVCGDWIGSIMDGPGGEVWGIRKQQEERGRSAVGRVVYW